MTTQRTPLMDISNNDMTSSPAGAISNRRKSGRAVKIPEKFVPAPSSSQAAPASAKRKRGGEDVENDASDIDEEEEEEEGSEEEIESAAEEEIKEARRKAKSARKPAAKKPKTNGTASHKSASAVRLPSRAKQGAKKGTKILIADREADGLYAEIFTSGKHAEDVAGQFLKEYSEDSPTALTDFMNMVLKSTGCNIQLTEDDINDAENAEGRLGAIQEEFQAQIGSDYPLISKAKSSVDFRNALVDFSVAMIQAMDKSGIMYNDAALLENVHLWLATMTSSTSRPFRHTATLLALTMTNSLCSVKREELDKAAKIRQQIKTEKANRGGNKARISQFQKNLAESVKKEEFITERITDFFDTVYVHRYRDIDPKIRAECVKALGTWIRTLPGTYADGSFLRYMGWMMSDLQSVVRLEVIEQLNEIMSINDLRPNLMTFIERFRPILIEIATVDADPVVRAAGVELADQIREAGMLEPDDIDLIGKLIYDLEPKVRKAVVGFFVAGLEEVYENKVSELGGDDELEILAIEDDESEAPRKEWIKLKALAELLASYDTEDRDDDPSQPDQTADDQFLRVSTIESRFTRATQVLYEKMPEVKDWAMVANYLLFDHSAKPSGNKSLRAIKESFKPTEQEEIVLLEMLNASVKLSLAPADNSGDGKSKKARDELAHTKESTARRLATLIPRLLKKYGALPKTATVVLRLEHILNLGIFQDLRQDSTTYTKLLDEISTQFSAHADRDVLTEASAALLHARGFEELEEITENKVQSLWEDTIDVLRTISTSGDVTSRGKLPESTLTELSHVLARLDKLAGISNCVEVLEAKVDGVMSITIVLDIVGRGQFEGDGDMDSLEDEVAMTAMHLAMFYFMWKVKSWSESEEPIPDSDIDELLESQEFFGNNLISALSSRDGIDPVRLFATGALIDLHVLFISFRQVDNDHLQSAVKEIDVNVQTELTTIFTQLEKHYAKVTRKRLEQPGEDEDPEDPEDETDEEIDPDLTDTERYKQTVDAERQLCELTSKLVLAIIAKVIDQHSETKGKLISRIQRNRSKLGPNFRDVVANLDQPKSTRSKSHKSKAQQIADAAKKAKTARSREVVNEEEEEEEDPFADEPEEGTAEDLRNRELEDDDDDVLMDDAPTSVAGGNGVAEDAEEDNDDDVLGD